MLALSLDHWFTVAQISTAIFFSVAALIVLAQQLKNAKIKQRLELYDRRLNILKVSQEHTSKLLNDNEFAARDTVNFRTSIAEAKHLFKKEVVKELSNLADKGFEIHHLQAFVDENLRGIVSEKSPKKPARKMADLKISIHDDSDRLFKCFDKYLNLNS